MLGVMLRLQVMAPRGPKSSTCSQVPVPCADQFFASEFGLCSCSLVFYWLYIIIKKCDCEFCSTPSAGIHVLLTLHAHFCDGFSRASWESCSELLRPSSCWAEKCRIWVKIALSWFARGAALKFPAQQKQQTAQGAGHEPSWLGCAGQLWVKLQVTASHPVLPLGPRNS